MVTYAAVGGCYHRYVQGVGMRMIMLLCASIYRSGYIYAHVTVFDMYVHVAIALVILGLRGIYLYVY